MRLARIRHHRSVRGLPGTIPQVSRMGVTGCGRRIVDLLRNAKVDARFTTGHFGTLTSNEVVACELGRAERTMPARSGMTGPRG
jgi:hypothetical protein